MAELSNRSPACEHELLINYCAGGGVGWKRGMEKNSREPQREGGEQTMEGNRDEAEKCINIATKALEAGDKEKAIKFLNKAEKLFPTDKAKGNVKQRLG